MAIIIFSLRKNFMFRSLALMGDMTIMTEENPALPSTQSLFLGDLSFFCTEDDLRCLFETFGKITSVEIKRGKFGDSLMHGFVEMDSSESAQLAMEALNESRFMGRNIRINWAYGNMTKLRPRNRDGWVQVHISFFMSNMEMKVTEERLRSLFEKFGEIADVTVKKHMRTNDPPMQSGYAFVYFLKSEHGVAAVQEMKAVTIDEISYECSLSYKSEMTLTGCTSPVTSSASTPTAAKKAKNAASTSRGATNTTGTTSSVNNSNGKVIAAALPSAVSTVNPSKLQKSNSDSFHQSNDCVTVTASPISNSNPDQLPPSRSLSRTSSGGKPTENIHKLGISRPPPLVTQFPQSRMTIQHNLRVNSSAQPSPMASTDSTPTSSPSFYMYQHPHNKGMIPPGTYPIGYFGSGSSSATASPHHFSLPNQPHHSPSNNVHNHVIPAATSPYHHMPPAAFYAPYPTMMASSPAHYHANNSNNCSGTPNSAMVPPNVYQTVTMPMYQPSPNGVINNTAAFQATTIHPHAATYYNAPITTTSGYLPSESHYHHHPQHHNTNNNMTTNSVNTITTGMSHLAINSNPSAAPSSAAGSLPMPVNYVPIVMPPPSQQQQSPHAFQLQLQPPAYTMAPAMHEQQNHSSVLSPAANTAGVYHVPTQHNVLQHIPMAQPKHQQQQVYHAAVPYATAYNPPLPSHPQNEPYSAHH